MPYVPGGESLITAAVNTMASSFTFNAHNEDQLLSFTKFIKHS